MHMSDDPPLTYSGFHLNVPSKDSSESIEHMALLIKKMNTLLSSPQNETEIWAQVSHFYKKISLEFDNIDWPETTEVEALNVALLDLEALIRKRSPKQEIIRIGNQIDKLLYLIVHP